MLVLSSGLAPHFAMLRISQHARTRLRIPLLTHTMLIPPLTCPTYHYAPQVVRHVNQDGKGHSPLRFK